MSLDSNPMGGFVRTVDVLTRALSHFNVAMGSASGLSTMMLILIIVPDVLCRSFLGFTIPFASEIAVLLLSCKIFLGMPGAQASRANFSVTFLTSRLSPAPAYVVRIFSLSLSLILISLLAWYVSGEAVRATQKEEAIFVGASQFVVWPQRIVIAIGLCLLSLQLSADLLRALLRLPNAITKKEGGAAVGHVEPADIAQRPPVLDLKPESQGLSNGSLQRSI